MLTTGWFLLTTEFKLLFRRSHEWLYPMSFFLIIVCIFPLAFSPDPLFLQRYIPGCVWIAALFSSLLSMESIFYAELEEGNLEQLLLSQAPLSFLLLAKFAAQWIVNELPLILLTPVIGVLFHLPFSAIVPLIAGLLIGTPILILLNSLGIALTLGLRQQGVLLGLLILPLLTPVIIFGVTIVQQSQAGFSIGAALCFFAGIALLAILLLPLAIAQALRISMDH